MLVRRRFLSLLAALPFIDAESLFPSSRANAPYVSTSTDKVVIGNSLLELEFDTNDGTLLQFYDRLHDRELLDRDYTQPPWQIVFFDEFRTRDDELNVEISSESSEEEATLTLVWSEVVVEEILYDDDGDFKGTVIVDGFDLTITIEIAVEQNAAESEWTFSIENESDLAIEAVHCPRIGGVKALTKDSLDALIVPRSGGRRHRNPTEREHLPLNAYPSTFGTMQFTAYLADESGIYASATDTKGHFKRLEFTGSGPDGIMDYEATHFEPYRPGEDVELPYSMVVGPHAGNWPSVCDRYRAWVETEGWLNQSDPLIPDRLKKRGITHHQRSYNREENQADEVVVSTFDEFKEMGVNLAEHYQTPMGLRWWGWQRFGEPGGGDFWPPYEGIEAFKKVVETFVDRDIGVHCFLNPTRVIERSEFWQNLDNPETLAMKDQDGSTRTRTTEGLTSHVVEPFHPTWQDYYIDVIDKLLDAGVRHIELDGIPHGWDNPCWNEAHDHPLGRGGTWYAEGIKALLKTIHEEFEVPGGLILGGEGVADFYLPYLNMHVLGDTAVEAGDSDVEDGLAEPIPLFTYTFGDYAITRLERGHIGTFTDMENIQRIWAGRSVMFGGIPYVMGTIEPISTEYDEDLLDYLGRLADARATYASKYLGSGTMLPPLEIETDVITVEEFDTTVRSEEILHSVWRSSGGEFGVLLTNVSNRSDPRSIMINLTEQDHDLPDDPLVYEVRNGRYGLGTGLHLELELEQADVLMLGVISYSEEAEQALQQLETSQEAEHREEDVLEAARRAFDDRKFAEAETLAEAAVVDEETSPSTPTPGDLTPTPIPGEPTPSPGSVEGDAIPGPGVIGTVGSLLGAGYMLKWWNYKQNEYEG